MAKIYIFRHGQTTDNKAHIFSGWRDVDLTPEGIQEAHQIAEKLKEIPITKAYHSDEIRSTHTLDLALKYHPNTPTFMDARIKERDYGNLTGTSKDDLARKDPVNFKLWHRSYDNPPPGGESLKDVEARVTPFLEELVQDIQPNDVVAISAHGNSIRPMRKFFEHLSNEEMASYEYTPAQVFEYTV